MAKRKRARATARKATRTAQGAGRLRQARPARKVAKKAAQKKNRPKATVRKKGLRRSTGTARPAARKREALKASRTKKTVGKSAARSRARKPPARPATARKAATKASSRKKQARSRKPAVRSAVTRPAKRAAPPRRVAAPAARAQVAPSPRPSRRAANQAVKARKAPALNRERRVISDEDFTPSPPSSLDLDRTASAARSGRLELAEKFHEHTETSPVLTGGDVDGDWESAYSVGDEAPGGDNPTPDQAIVDDIGSALGVVYEDDEELTSEKKISDRDKHRWELDPESSDDYDER